MKIVFFGNTKYSLVGARIIHEYLSLSAIVTIADRPDKRGRLLPSPLKQFGLEEKIPVLTFDKLDQKSIEQVAALHPDFLVVEDYGLLLPEKLLTVPTVASLNIHHSLLPKYRGTSPAPTALLNGDTQTGVTVMKMAKELDAGDILAQVDYTIQPDDTTDSLLTILNTFGAEMLILVIKDFEQLEAIPQDHKKATFTQKISKQDGYIDRNNPPKKEKLDRMIRAYYPWPTVWTRLIVSGKEKIVKLLPGKKLQVEGKNPMTVKDFINGYPELENVIKKLFD